jgi:hypothetical protein
MLSVQGWKGLESEEELTRISICTIVGHTQETFLGVLHESLIFKFAPHVTVLAVWRINGLSTGSVGLGEVSKLDAKTGYDTMDLAKLIR